MSKLVNILRKVQYSVSQFATPVIIAYGIVIWGASHFIKPPERTPDNYSINDMRKQGRVFEEEICNKLECDDKYQHTHFYEIDKKTKKRLDNEIIIHSGQRDVDLTLTSGANYILLLSAGCLLYSLQTRKNNPFIYKNEMFDRVTLGLSDLSYTAFLWTILSPILYTNSLDTIAKYALGAGFFSHALTTTFTVPKLIKKKIERYNPDTDENSSISRLWILKICKQNAFENIKLGNLDDALKDAYTMASMYRLISPHEKDYAQHMMTKKLPGIHSIKRVGRLLKGDENSHLINLVEMITNFSINYSTYLKIVQSDRTDDIEYKLISFASQINDEIRKRIGLEIYKERKSKGKLIRSSTQTKNKVEFMDCDRIGVTFAIKEGLLSDLEGEVRQTENINYKHINAYNGETVNIHELIPLSHEKSENSNNSQKAILWYSFIKGQTVQEYFYTHNFQTNLRLLKKLLRFNGIVSLYGVNKTEEDIELKVFQDIENSPTGEKSKIIFRDAIPILTKYKNIYDSVYDRDGNPGNFIITIENGKETIYLLDLDERKKSNIAYSSIKTMEQDTIIPFSENGWKIRNELVSHYLEGANLPKFEISLCNHHSSVPLKAISYSAFTLNKPSREKSTLRFYQSAKFSLEMLLHDFGSHYTSEETVILRQVINAFHDEITYFR